MKTLSIGSLSVESRSRPFFIAAVQPGRQMRVPHALLAATLAVAVLLVPVGAATTTGAPAQPTPAPAPQVDEGAPPEQPVEVLALADEVANRSAVRETTLDVGPSVDTATDAASSELRTVRALARVRDADDPDAALADELDRIEARATDLRGRQRATLRAFAEGEADARSTLLSLVRIDQTARALDDRRERVVAAARGEGATVPSERSAALGRELAVHTGPLRDRVAAALSGEEPATRVYVSTTPRGVTLAALTDSGYVRETYRGELRRIGGEPLDRSAASDAVAAAYPSVWDARRAVDVDPARVSAVRVTYDGGELAATVGSGNGQVFRDVHRQSLGVAGTDQQAVNTRDGLRILVNRSYAGGPMRVQLRTVEGEPVAANLTIGPEGGESSPAGSTGPDGERWLLTPDERFTLVAIRGNSVVFITMDPLPAPRTERP